MKKIFLSCFFLYSGIIFAQDTVRIMHYNLLSYGTSTTYCDQNNNNLTTKDNALKLILSQLKPDLFTVNECGANQLTANHLLGIVNASNGKVYAMGQYSNLTSSDLVNCFFYNTAVFTLVKQANVSVSVREFNIFKVRYNSSDISHGDTAYLTCIVGHLKAGQTSADAATRAQMTQTLMNYLISHNYSGNITISGDFNLYTSSEEAYQNLVSEPDNEVCFHDPINKPGNWNNSSTFANYHTQSTHSTSNGCAASGGFDDRFDFILMNQHVLNGDQKVSYINGSYKAYGQNGTAFNGSILNMNISLSLDIKQALYNLSDHLPVIADLYIDQAHVSVFNAVKRNSFVLSYGPDEIFFSNNDLSGEFQVNLISITGNKIYSENFYAAGGFDIHIPFQVDGGLYILQIIKNQRIVFSAKVLKFE